MATGCQKILIPLAEAGSKRPHLNPLIPKLPSSSVSKTPLRSPSPSPYSTGGTQRSNIQKPQNGLIEISSDESDESDDLSVSSLLEQVWGKFKKLNSGAGTGMAWNSRRDWTTGC
jgi:hypothetical protein